jgi:hypothetical protein
MIQVSGKSSPMKEVIMVDPLEAKRLAAKQMKEIQKRERFKVKDISCAFKISYPLV